VSSITGEIMILVDWSVITVLWVVFRVNFGH